jgi:hypothetical protein
MFGVSRILKAISPQPPDLFAAPGDDCAVDEYTSLTMTSAEGLDGGEIADVKYLLRVFNQDGTPTPQELLRNEGRSGTTD